MRTYAEQPSIPEVLARQPRARDRFFTCDIAELVEIVGSDEPYTATLRNGSPELTAQADKFMTKFEDDVFVGRAWNCVDGVVGAVPNIPAFLAGHPQHMRRRQRTTSASGPIAIMLELTGSSGTMSERAVRGAAMLALARLLTNARPVELWTLVTYGMTNSMDMLACRIDTAPLDVSRAAAMLMDQTAFGSANIAHKRVLRQDKASGGWSYGLPEMERRWSGEAFRRFLGMGTEILFIPAAYLSDNFRDPERWVRDMLNKYGMGAVIRGEDEQC